MRANGTWRAASVNLMKLRPCQIGIDRFGSCNLLGHSVTDKWVLVGQVDPPLMEVGQYFALRRVAARLGSTRAFSRFIQKVVFQHRVSIVDNLLESASHAPCLAISGV